MKILFITSFLPKKNASQAGVNCTYNTIKMLKDSFDGEIDLLCTLNTNELSEDTTEIELLTRKRFIVPVGVKEKIKNTILNFNRPAITSVRYDRRIKKIIASELKDEYDYIFVDYTQNILYIKDIKKYLTKAKTALIEHDVSYLGFRRKYQNEKNLVKKCFYYLEYKRLRKEELSLAEKYDKVFTLNEKDRNLLNNGSNVDVFQPYINKMEVNKIKHDGLNIMFWGAMNRKENKDAIMYFINEIWPHVNKENVKFYIIGNKPDDSIKQLASDNVIVTGFVEDPGEYFSIMDLSVVPLRLGAGIKIKVLESLYSGIPVITTDVGVEGIELENGKDIIVENDPKEFSKKVNELISNYELRRYLSVNGREVIKLKYNFSNNKKVLSEFIKQKNVLDASNLIIENSNL